MARIAVVLGSTRPGRNGEVVARWVIDGLTRRLSGTGIDVELLDLADFALPPLDEPMPAMMGQYQHEHTRRWAEAVARFDGYVFVTAEYNCGIPGTFKNAFDYLYAEWVEKPVAFVSYGADGGVRAVEQWRQVVANAEMVDVRARVSLGMFTDFVDFGQGGFTPMERRGEELEAVADSLAAFVPALATMRARSADLAKKASQATELERDAADA